jgi:Zn-dependent protease
MIPGDLLPKNDESITDKPGANHAVSVASGKPEFRYSPAVIEIIQALKDSENSKKSGRQNLIFLLISVFLFFSFGLFKNPLTDLAILIGVLFIHETGHLLVMNKFGYKNIQMFFIPFFGAAVAGKAQNISGAKKAIVALAGPVPGIAVGIVTAIFSILTQQDLVRQIALTFIFINGLNLLPFYPFDGGRFVFEILFCRSRNAEVLFKFIAGAVFFIFGLVAKDWFIGIIGFLVLISVPTAFRIGSLAMMIKKEVEIDKLKPLLESPPQLIEKIITSGKITRTGFWSNGKWDSTWIEYDTLGNISCKTVFDNGIFIYKEVKTISGFKKVDFDALPYIEKEVMKDHISNPPLRAKNTGN